MTQQQPLPQRYMQMSDSELAAAISQRKRELGDKLVILAHHYQRDEIIQFADFTGDSFKLAQLAAKRVKDAGAKYVIFCGVHFMAESADILTDDDVAVILPDLEAGCSMADMADYDQTLEAWQRIHSVLDARGFQGRVIPVCYMNSTAAIKAFCGEHGGAVSTSSNCEKVFDWALTGGDEPLEEGHEAKILFLPDEHLGRNSAAALGFDPTTDMAVWDPTSPDELGGCTEQGISQARLILWKGFCSVHMMFTPQDVDRVRADRPDVKVIVHPECTYEVCRKADMTGSTEGIIKALNAAEPGTNWAIGTEVHMVDRLCREVARRDIKASMLSDFQCLCATMYRIDMRHLLWTMDNLAEGKLVNQICVDSQTSKLAEASLNRMLAINANPQTVD